MIPYLQRYMPMKYVYGFSEGRNAKNRQKKTGCSGLEVVLLIFRFELSLTTNLYVPNIGETSFERCDPFCVIILKLYV